MEKGLIMDNLRSNYTLTIYEKAMPNTLTLQEKLLCAKECGFDALELSIDETDEKQKRLDWTNEEILNILSFCNSNDIYIRSICLSAHRKYPFGSHYIHKREQGMSIMKKAIHLADKLGVRMIQLAGYDVYYEESDDSTKADFLNNLSAAVEYAAKYGVILAFETMETEFMDTIEKAMDYVNKISSPYLKIYPDTGNLSNAYFKYGTEHEYDLNMGKYHIAAAHLKETTPGKYRDMMFGTGKTDYIRFLRELWKYGVRRYTAEFWYLGEENWKENVRNACSFLRTRIESVAKEG